MMGSNPVEKSRKVRGAVARAGLVVLLIGGAVTFGILRTSPAGPAAPSGAGVQQAEQLSSAFKEVAKNIGPAVVNIRSTKKINVGNRSGGRGQRGQRGQRNPRGGGNGQNDQADPRDLFGDDFLKRFFDQFGENGPQFEMPQGPMEQQGVGSGVIVSKDGYILTNNHVVSGADDIQVTLTDKKEHKARLVGTDEVTDLAVIKVDNGSLPYAQLGDSDAIDVGDWVVAIGSPLMLQHTVTTGIVSAKGRQQVGIAEFEDFIQTDAAINPGNSGGPLLNLRGQVIGINTAIATETGGWMGIGFAIPSNMAKSVMKTIIEKGHVTRGMLGVQISDLDEDMARSFNYKGTDGALVQQLTKDSPAAKAGIQEGDIITEFNGKPVKNTVELRNGVAALAPGSTADLTIFRDGKTQPLHATVVERTNGKKEAKAQTSEETQGQLGMTVQTLTPERADAMNLDATSGVIVTQVDNGSPAAHAGIRRGDVILRVEGRQIANAEDFRTAVKKMDVKKGIRLQILSGGAKRFAFLKGEE